MVLFANKEDTLQKLFLIFSVLVVVTLPFSVPLNGLSMLMLSAVWLAEGKWKMKWQKFRDNKIALLFVGLYLLHVIGLFHTENIDQGFFELEKRVAFLVYPVIFSTTGYFDRMTVRRILTAFTVTCFIAAIICILNGLYFFLRGDSSYMYYHKLGSAVNFDHAIYFSFYICISIFHLLTSLELGWNVLTKTRKVGLVAMVCFLLTFLFLLSSKTLIISSLLLLVVFGGRILARVKGLKIGILAVMLGFCLSGILIFTIPNIKQRFNEVLIDRYEQTNPLFLDDYQYYHFTGGAIRLAIWKMVYIIIDRQNAWLWGVGTGDAQDELTKIYLEKNIYPGDKELKIKGFLHYNAHNQFLQFFLTFGFIGLGLFLYLMASLFKTSWRQPPLMFYFLVSFTFFSLTEATLHVQKGIVPFAFFSALFTAYFGERPRTPLNRGAN